MQTTWRAALALVALYLLTAAGCATAFSPDMVRREIVRQGGESPKRALEVRLGRFTTRLVRQVLGNNEGDVPFAGLAGLELAVFESGSRERPVLDVTAIPVRGWEPVLKLHDETRSGMILVRGTARRSGTGGERARVADLVVMGSGTTQVVYARLWGELDPALPGALGEVLREDGAEGVRGLLSALAEDPE